MNKFVIVLVSFVAFFILQSMVMKKDGAAPGYTGSPGDTFKNCTACHGGTAVNVNNWITSDIPDEGYVPGQTYTITATNKESGATRFGFEISPQDTLGNLLGTMVITDAIRTKFVGGTKYITYTENGVEGQDSLSWTFKWVAPQTDEVVFYGGFNSNFDGHKGGDQTFLSQLKVKRNTSSSISKVSTEQSLFVYPNPASDYILVEYDSKVAGNVSIDVFDLNGKQVLTLMDGSINVGKFSKKFDVKSLAEGQYLLKFNVNGTTAFKQIKIAQ